MFDVRGPDDGASELRLAVGSSQPSRATDSLTEGDLIIGNHSTALATLVERKTRYTVLVQLPGRRTMDALNASLEAAFAQMAAPLVRTLTWDQGKEIAGHSELAAVTGLDVLVCERSSPW